MQTSQFRLLLAGLENCFQFPLILMDLFNGGPFLLCLLVGGKYNTPTRKFKKKMNRTSEKVRSGSYGNSRSILIFELPVPILSFSQMEQG